MCDHSLVSPHWHSRRQLQLDDRVLAVGSGLEPGHGWQNGDSAEGGSIAGKL